MTDSPTENQPGFVTEEPEHCFACFRLIRPDQTCCLTICSTQSSNGWEDSARIGETHPGCPEGAPPFLPNFGSGARRVVASTTLTWVARRFELDTSSYWLRMSRRWLLKSTAGAFGRAA
jgi:hypothetical protein